MRLLVCGGRYFDDVILPHRTLNANHFSRGHVQVLVEGGAPGADILAREWARARGILVETYRAEWSKYGRSAGPKRNARMLAEGKSDLVVAFEGGTGTANMVRLAREAGVEVIEVAPYRGAS